MRPQTKTSSKCLDYSFHLQHVCHTFFDFTPPNDLYMEFYVFKKSFVGPLNLPQGTRDTPGALTTWIHENNAAL